MATIKKAKDGDLLDRVSKTKLKDVPQKVKNLGNKVIKKVRNTTVGDVGNAVYNVSGVKPIVDLAKKAANSETVKYIKKDLKRGLKHGGSVKMKNGGSLSGLKASNKRDKGIDPNGAFTKVQKKTLAGAKGIASLTKDKQLGATRMAKRGMSIKKK